MDDYKVIATSTRVDMVCVVCGKEVVCEDASLSEPCFFPCPHSGVGNKCLCRKCSQENPGLVISFIDNRRKELIKWGYDVVADKLGLLKISNERL